MSKKYIEEILESLSLPEEKVRVRELLYKIRTDSDLQAVFPTNDITPQLLQARLVWIVDLPSKAGPNIRSEVLGRIWHWRFRGVRW